MNPVGSPTDKVTHLEMIQRVIERMGRNSFKLKQWSVVLIAAFLGLGAAASEPAMALLAYIPLVSFWFLDTYYLRQERLFRCLYNNVRERPNDEIDFSMATTPTGGNHNFLQVMVSRTLSGFYGPLVIAILIVAVVSK